MKKLLLAAVIALLAVLPAAAEESDRYSVSFSGADYTLTAELSSGGKRAAVAVSLRNQGNDPLTLSVRAVALNGEDTGVFFSLEARPGRTVRKRVMFEKEELGSLTRAEVWADVVRPDGKTEGRLLSVYPLGEGRAERLSLNAEEPSSAAYDDENAGVFLYGLSGPSAARNEDLTFSFGMVNRTNSLLRLVIQAVNGRGETLEAPYVTDLIPQSVGYLPAKIPLSFFDSPWSPALTLRISGYVPGSELPLLSAEYELDPLAPRAVPTIRPTQAPGPLRIGTVTIRKSGDVNVREEGSTQSRKVGSAKAGKSYPCYGVSGSGWYLIELDDGTRGYVTNAYSTLVRE